MTILQDLMKGFGASKEELQRLTEKYERAKNVDTVISEFKRFMDEKKTLPNGGGPEYFVAKHEAELLQKLKEGWKLIRPLNGNKYLLQHA